MNCSYQPQLGERAEPNLSLPDADKFTVQECKQLQRGRRAPGLGNGDSCCAAFLPFPFFAIDHGQPQSAFRVGHSLGLPVVVIAAAAGVVGEAA